MNILICAICNNPFIGKRSDAKYCSERCRTRQETMNRTSKRRMSLTTVERNCLVCHSLFSPSVYRHDQVYCSPKCLSKAMNKRAVETGRRKEQYYKHKEKYAALKSETDLGYKDEIRFSGNKKHVLERDGNKCVDCGKKKGLIIHHKDGSGSSETPNNEMDNLITLCRSCHMRHHSGENSHQFIQLSKEKIIDVRRESSSWEEVARKLNITRQTLIKKRKLLGIF